MKSNPYATALAAIGLIGLTLAGIAWVIGVYEQSDYSPEISMAWFSVAGALFPLAVIGMIAWLLLEGLRWNQLAAASVRETTEAQ